MLYEQKVFSIDVLKMRRWFIVHSSSTLKKKEKKPETNRTFLDCLVWKT